jgi:hypothetical protein
MTKWHSVISFVGLQLNISEQVGYIYLQIMKMMAELEIIFNVKIDLRESYPNPKGPGWLNYGPNAHHCQRRLYVSI